MSGSDLPGHEASREPAAGSGGAAGFAQPPSVSLPKGGGAIRGIGEKFGTNPVTGTASFSVPIATSPGRSGFGPQLSLSYDSGAGNGPFGLGWNLALPAITRKTDKGLPRYRDEVDSDEFILSGAEDLVPVLVEANGGWVREELPVRRVDGMRYRVERYRPRIEGLFARIERWTNEVDPTDCSWRSISGDNITTWYGKSRDSRIADPADPSRIFSWLICESHDDKGNVMVYDYQQEDSANVGLALAHEANRNDLSRSANRYLKRICYGNRRPYFPVLQDGEPATPLPSEWLFEVVLDYGDHDELAPTPRPDGSWSCRSDPFSSYRAGFEVRTYRLCQRVLMFHHFADEPGVGADCLVRSTDFHYRYEEDPGDARNPIHSVLISAAQSGYRRQSEESYLQRSLPPVEFRYSEARIDEAVLDVDPASLEHLPDGLSSNRYRWTDLDGEGLSGVLIDQGEAWYYKRNLSPINGGSGDGGETVVAQFGALERVVDKPSSGAIVSGGHQLLDLAGDGQLDLVSFEVGSSGFFERSDDRGWVTFRPFRSLPNLDWRNPNLRFLDLTGDGRADLLISEEDAFSWHTSLGEEGFGPAQRVPQALDEEEGPRLVLSDGTQSIHLADLSGDGLTDLVRIRNGEVCYWPSLGYGRFGAKVTMDNAPWFDGPDLFDQRRVRLADIDGSGVTDIIYLADDGVDLYFNQSGNSWSAPQRLTAFPMVDDLSSVQVLDLLGNGTACLVWSSPLPGDSRRPMRYVDLMGGQKPHLMVGSENNLGAETRIHYASSTKFSVADQLAGRPWITRLPFPVHVVERVETFDHISRNRFVTRYAYHHGFYDGLEREFRGFGMVEQWDSEELANLDPSDQRPAAANIEEASHVPPVLTRTWYHTGVWFGHDHVSDYFAGRSDGADLGEYYREPGLTDAEARDLLLEDTVLPEGLSTEEGREACRALKGTQLRREIYSLDGSDREPHPHSVREKSFSVRRLQPRADNRHAVFSTHERESVSYHYERNPGDPRVSHSLTLEVDEFGNVWKGASIGYGRRQPDPSLRPEDQAVQAQTLITYIERSFTNAVESDDDHRTPLPCEARTYELSGYQPTGPGVRYEVSDFVAPDPSDPDGSSTVHVFDGDVPYEDTPPAGSRQRRLFESSRILYRPDDFGLSPDDDPSALLPLGAVESLALPGESYQLAFTPGLLAQVYERDGAPLLPDPEAVLAGQGADQGGYVDLDGDGHWWIPSGRTFHSPGSADSAAQERDHSLEHFLLSRRSRDPFGQTTTVTYDAYDLLVLETQDPLGNWITVGERAADGTITEPGNDYRVLRPWQVMDPNRNRTQVAFDALGTVVGTAVMAKPEENLGDSLDDFEPDLTETEMLAHLTDPLADRHAILGGATTRWVYDLSAYERTKDRLSPQPTVTYSLARETHHSDVEPGQRTETQLSFSYSDGFGRTVQKKVRGEPGPAPARDSDGAIVVDPDGHPVMTGSDVTPRWIGSGWTVFNNKGKPIRRFEPFFSDTHRFELDARIGVSHLLLYDPVGRVIATLHPNHSWEKKLLDPWRQDAWDVNDTVLVADPASDADVGEFFQRLPQDEYLPTWYQQRQNGALGPEAQAAADQAAVYSGSPTIAHLDPLGRAFLSVAHNKFRRSDAPPSDPPTEETHRTRIVFDIQGDRREVVDANDRAVARYDHHMAGPDRQTGSGQGDDAKEPLIRQSSMEAGQRWQLDDVAGNRIRAWDSRNHELRMEHDDLRRVVGTYLRHEAGGELLVERTVYGESHPDAEGRNLREKVLELFDQAGVVTTDDYDFNGNLLSSRQQFAREYETTLDWSASVLLEAETFVSRRRYDALGRPVQLIAPHADRAEANVSVLQPRYNESNALAQLDAWIDESGEPADLLDPSTASFRAITAVEHDAKGRRTRVEYGNGASTTYEYDRLSSLLSRLLTRRDPSSFPDDCPQPAPAGWPGCQVQDLHYTYDPAGNIVRVRDDAQQTIFFRNKRVEPSAAYTYDALYRLIEASGREHLGHTGGGPIPHSHHYADRTGSSHPGDGTALGTYVERYRYDAVGNILDMQHRGSDPAHPGWTRSYEYREPSLIESVEVSNRLSRTRIGGGSRPVESYDHDTHGNLVSIPHLGGGGLGPNLLWDYRDQLRQAELGGGGTVYYVYDSTGQRVRKVWEKSDGLVEEHLYLGGLEIFRRRRGADLLERETLHLMDDTDRIALVETRTLDTAGDDPAPPRLIRYQLGNHLGSATLELDDQAQIISYEEYTPYGSTSYQAARSQVETPKRYRYTGRERDEESGLYHHGDRYYACWLARWCSPDPAGLVDNSSLYAYTGNNPVLRVDKTGRAWEISKTVSPSGDVHYDIQLTGAVLVQADIVDLTHDYGPDEPFRHLSSEQLAALITDRLEAKFSGKEVLDAGQTISWSMRANIRGIEERSELKRDEREHLFEVLDKVPSPIGEPFGRGDMYGTRVRLNEQVVRQSREDKTVWLRDTVEHELGHTGGLEHPHYDYQGFLSWFETTWLGRFFRPNAPTTAIIENNESEKSNPMSYYEDNPEKKFSAAQIEEIYSNYASGSLNRYLLTETEKALLTGRLR